MSVAPTCLKHDFAQVIAHPSDVFEVQIKKEHFEARAGQYVMLNWYVTDSSGRPEVRAPLPSAEPLGRPAFFSPEVSYLQYHPFTLTSAPEEDYLSVHIRCVPTCTFEALAPAP